MTNFLIIAVYLLAAYGACNIIAFGEGPFHIFENLRLWADNINPHFGKLFSCMMCLPANFGWIFSLVNWFLLPEVPITPFNIILVGSSLWWLAMLFDGAITSGFCWLMYRLDDLMGAITTKNEAQTLKLTDNSTDKKEKQLLVEDITIKNKNNG